MKIQITASVQEISKSQMHESNCSPNLSCNPKHIPNPDPIVTIAP